MATTIQETDAALLAGSKEILSASRSGHNPSALCAATENKIQEKYVMTETQISEMVAISVKFSPSGTVPRLSPAHAKGREGSSVETECLIQPTRNAMTEIR